VCCYYPIILSQIHHKYPITISIPITITFTELLLNRVMKPEMNRESVALALLPKSNQISATSSISAAVFNVSTCMIGAGIMSVPATLKVLGIVPGFLVILIMAFLMEVTVEFLLRYTNYSGDANTYGGVMAESFGKFGSFALQICVMISNLGALIIYLIIIGDVLTGNESEGVLHLGILQQCFGFHWWNSRAYSLLFVVIFVMLPLLLLPRVVHPVRAELEKQSDMSTAVRISLVLSVVIYLAVGFVGYLLFGDSIMADMLVNFDQTSNLPGGLMINAIVRLSYAIHLMLVFPVIFYTLRANMDEMIFPRKSLLANDTTRFMSLTCVLLAFIYVVAIALPNIWYFFQFMGSTTVACIAFVFPGAIVLRDVHGISTRKDRVMAIMVLRDLKMSPENSDEVVPLLPENGSPTASPEEKQPSVSGAVFNVSTSIIGAGIMSIPATFKVLGVVPAFILIVLIGWLVDVSVEFMLRFTYAGGSTTYAGLMKESFGRIGSVTVQICVMIQNLGCLIIYLIIIGDVLSGDQSGEGSVHLGVLQEWFGIHWWNTRDVAILIVVVFVMLPLVLFRRVESLSMSSAVAVLLAVVFVGICSAMAISAAIKGQSKSIKLLPQLNNQVAFYNLFTAIPVIVTAFTFHFNVHISLVVCALIYFCIGLFGYILFGDSIEADILVNFDHASGSMVGSVLNDIVRLSYAFHLMLVFPLLNFSLRSNIDEFLFPDKSLLAKDSKRFVSLTFVLLAAAYLMAIAIPNIWYFFQFMGSTSAVSLAFIFPGAIALRDVHGISSRKDKIIGATMIILAVITSTIAISSNLYSLGNNS
ncbi:Amino acid transporter, transmembrane, partial [Cynara cardunculus var. scolymus]